MLGTSNWSKKFGCAVTPILTSEHPFTTWALVSATPSPIKKAVPNCPGAGSGLPDEGE
jgi:hypothetical protein